MLFKIPLLLFIMLNGGTDSATIESSRTILREIEENQGLGMDCSVYSNSLESFMNEYKQMYHSLTIACQLQLKQTAGRVKSTIDSMVEQKIEEYLTSVEVMKSKLNEIKKFSLFNSAENVHEKYQEEIKSLEMHNNNLTDRIKKIEFIWDHSDQNCRHEGTERFDDILLLIRKGQFSVACKQVSEFGEVYLIKIITSVYDKNVANAELILDFLNSCPDEDYIILGYRLLFDEMKLRNHIYNTATTAIAYRVFGDFKNRNNVNLLYLKANLPESFQIFPWNQVVVVANGKLKELFRFWWHPPFYYDDLRLNPYTHPITVDGHSKVALIPELNGKYFNLKSILYDFYLYADTDEFSLDSQRRSVFLWMKKNEMRETGRWQFEPILGSQNFKIKNVYWNEYLTLAEGVKVKDQGVLQLFTLRSNKCYDDLCQWNITKYVG